MLYDVIIVGGGPAGSIAGITLAHHGCQVLLLDKSRFPREKFCGGGLSLRILRRFPFLKDALNSIPVHALHNVAICSSNGTIALEKRETPIYLTIRRIDFDALLLNRCKQSGIHVFEEEKVSCLVPQTNTLEVVTNSGHNFSGKLIIGADGVHSTIAKQSGLHPGWAADTLAIDFMEERSSHEIQAQSPETMSVFYGYQGAQGYGYIFPKKDHVNIGIGFLKNYFRESIPQTPYEVYGQFVEFLNEHHFLKGKPDRRHFHGYFLPVGGPLQKTYADRILLCGDAAGVVNAFTGEGIYHAMVSGEYAANMALRALEENNFSAAFLSAYQTNWQREIGKELETSVSIQQELFGNPALLDLIIKTAAQNASLRRTLTDYTIGELDYHTFKTRMLLRFAPLYAKYKLGKFFQRKHI